MKTMKTKLGIMMAAVGLAMQAVALDYTWQSTESDGYSGSYTNVLHWNCAYGNYLPGYRFSSIGVGVFDCRASYEVGFPASTSLLSSAGISVNVQEGESSDFRLKDTGWLLGPGTLTSAYFGSYPVKFMHNGVSVMELYAEGCTGPYNLLELTNTVVTLSATEDANKLVFDGGLVDFRDPCGGEWGTTKPWLVFHRAPVASSAVCFTNGASLRAYDLRIQTCGSTNKLFFIGGDHYVNAVRIPCTYNQSYASETVADTTFAISGGAQLSASQINVGTYYSSFGTTANKTTHLTVSGQGSRLESRGTVADMGDNSGGAGRLFIDVRDGAEMYAAGEVKLATAHACTTTVAVVDSAFSTSNRFTFGNYGDSRLFFCATNALLSSVNAASLIAGVDMELVDTVWTNVTTCSLGGSSTLQNAPVSMTMRGDETRLLLSDYLGVGYVDNASFTVDGGSNVLTTVYLGGNAGGTAAAGTSPTGTLTVSGGYLSVNSGSGSKTIYVAGAYKSYGIVNVTGGKLAATSIFTGWCGAGELNVSGGELMVSSQIRIGNQADASETRDSVGRISGGSVYIGDSIMVANTAARKGRLILDGGSLSCNKTYGNGGISAFEADGGTLVPRTATTTLLYGFLDARLGTKGLTVNSDYAVTMTQVFSNKSTVVDGALILTGTGVKTLSAPASGEGRLVAAGGTVLLAPSSGTAVNRELASVIVTNGAALAFGSASVSAVFKSLTIGDGATPGTLQVYSGNRIVVDALSLGNTYLVFADTFPAGNTYPVITVRGRVDAATKSAWETAYVKSGRAASTCYTFEVSDYDEPSGTTVLSIVASSPAVPNVVNVWQGSVEGSAEWTNSANWGSTTLDKSAIATFSSVSAGVSDTVTLPVAGVVGALDFTADRNYTLTGGGPLVIADTGNGSISVSAGDQTIDTPVFLTDMLPVYVASGASLTFQDAIVHGGINKSGDGALFLNGRGMLFEQGLIAGGGLFSIADVSCFAAVAGAPEAQLKKGTLQIGGDPEASEATLPFTMKVAAASATEACVISNASDVVMPGMTVSSGAIVKRGTGTLVIEESVGNRTLASGNGSATAGNVPPAARLDFAANGTAPVAGHSGFTVTEGEVLFRSAVSATSPLTINCLYQTVLGMWSSNDIARAPQITADNAYVQFGGDQKIFYSGLNAYAGEYPENARTQYIRAVNGGTVRLNTLYAGYAADAEKTAEDVCLDVLADNGIFMVSSQAFTCRTGATMTLHARNGGAIYVGSSAFLLNGSVRLKLEGGSVFGRSSGEAAQINCGVAGVDLTADISGGASFDCFYLNWYKICNNAFTFNFDNGFWSAGKRDNLIAFRVGEQVRFNAFAGGVGFDVPETYTWSLYHPIRGAGGVSKRGLGTLRIENAGGYNLAQSMLTNFANHVTLLCSGTNSVESGRLVVTAGADGARVDVAADATLQAEGAVAGLTVSGAGTITGGTFSNLKILHSDSAVPKFDGAVVSDRVIVDLGHDANDPLPGLPLNVKVAEFTGAPSTIRGWKLMGTGIENVTGFFRVVDGSVYVDAKFTGSVILFK